MATLTIEVTEDGRILVGDDSEDMQAQSSTVPVAQDQSADYEQSEADTESGMQEAESIGDAVKIVTDWLHENTMSTEESSEGEAVKAKVAPQKGKIDPFNVGLLKAKGGQSAQGLPNIKMPGSMG